MRNENYCSAVVANNEEQFFSGTLKIHFSQETPTAKRTIPGGGGGLSPEFIFVSVWFV